MNKQETAQLLGMLQTHYPLAYKDFDNSMLNIAINTWHQGLQDLDPSLVFNVTQKIVMTDESHYPPKLAHIRKECIKALNPNSLMSPEVAFEKAQRAIKTFGRYNESQGLESLDPVIKRTVRTIGWQKWCDTPDDKMGFLKNDFIAFYDVYDSPEREEKLLPVQILHRLEEIRRDSDQKRLESNE